MRLLIPINIKAKINPKTTENIKLIIQEVSREKSNLSLLEAEKAIEESDRENGEPGTDSWRRA